MYKLVVVDDEAVIRKGMCNYIPWSEMGFKVAADFEDGKETIDYLKQNTVDVILTDIEMAQINGLKLASYVDEHKLPAKVVIVSGYKEFEYARKAVEYNVEHYLLKPIKLEEVKKVFGKIKKELDERKAEEEASIAAQKKFQELLPELQEQFLMSMLVSRISDREQLQKKVELLSLDFSLDNPCAILDVKMKEENNSDLTIFDNASSHGLIHNIFTNSSTNSDIKFYPIHLSSNINKVFAVTNLKETKISFIEKLKLQLVEKHHSVLKLLKLEAIISIEKAFDNLFQMAEYEYNFKIDKQDEANKDMQLFPADSEGMLQKDKFIGDKQNEFSKTIIEQAVDYMKRNYAEDISLEIIADRFFLSPAYFSRLFKQYTGTTFIEYLIELRMEKAKELLTLGKYKVYEVSQIVGYKSEKYFFSVFKRYTGCSPAEYFRSWTIKNEK
jgi:YesN/AraC family two-component response regulator